MSAQVFRFVADPRDARQFRLVGKGRWMNYGDGWLCAHDLLHHQPQDTGLLQEEMATYGVQSWIEGATRKTGWDEVDWCSVSGPICDTFRPSQRLDSLVLPAAPGVRKKVPPELLAQMARSVELAFADAADTIDGKYFERYDRRLPQRELDRFVGPRNQARAVGWMAYGFVRAQTRYPDPARASKLFASINSFFTQLRWESGAPKSISVELDVARLLFRPLSSRLTTAWRNACSKHGLEPAEPCPLPLSPRA